MQSPWSIHSIQLAILLEQDTHLKLNVSDQHPTNSGSSF